MEGQRPFTKLTTLEVMNHLLLNHHPRIHTDFPHAIQNLLKNIFKTTDNRCNLQQVCDALKNNNINFFETGIKHGTITAVIEGYKFEIADKNDNDSASQQVENKT